MTAAIQKQIDAAKALPLRSAGTSPVASAKELPRAAALPQTQEMTFPGKVPGNNGAGGLLRMHWRRRLELQKGYRLQVLVAGLRPMAGPVRLELVRYSIGPQMDFDNLVSTGKSTIDALVRCGILPDDNPTIIAERSYTQERAPDKASQRTVIRLIPL